MGMGRWVDYDSRPRCSCWLGLRFVAGWVARWVAGIIGWVLGGDWKIGGGRGREGRGGEGEEFIWE